MAIRYIYGRAAMKYNYMLWLIEICCIFIGRPTG